MGKIRVYRDLVNSYTQKIGVNSLTGVLVALDFIKSRLCYGFSGHDYFTIGNGYSLSAYQKKRFFSRHR